MVERGAFCDRNIEWRPFGLKLARDIFPIALPLAGLSLGLALGAYIAKKEGPGIRGLRKTEREIENRQCLFPPPY